MPAQVEGREAAAADGEFFGGGVQGRLQDGDAVVFEHVQEGGFAGVVEAEEEEFGVFVCQAQLGQHVPDCVLSSVGVV